MEYEKRVVKQGDRLIAVRPISEHDGWLMKLNNGATMLDGSEFDRSRILMKCTLPYFRIVASSKPAVDPSEVPYCHWPITELLKRLEA